MKAGVTQSGNHEHLERENVHSSVFLSVRVMSRLDEAMQSLETDHKTVQEPVPRTK